MWGTSMPNQSWTLWLSAASTNCGAAAVWDGITPSRTPSRSVRGLSPRTDDEQEKLRPVARREA